jgi:hypothetical protein
LASGEEGVELAQRRGFLGRRLAALQGRRNEAGAVGNRIRDMGVELRIGLRREARLVALEKAPDRVAVSDAGKAGDVEQKRKADRQLRVRHVAGVDVVDGIAEPLVPGLRGIGGKELLIFVDRPRDDAEGKLLGALGLAVDVESQAFGRAIGQPFVDGDAVALCFGDLLAILVQEQLVIEPFGRAAAQDAADL